MDVPSFSSSMDGVSKLLAQEAEYYFIASWDPIAVSDNHAGYQLQVNSIINYLYIEWELSSIVYSYRHPVIVQW